MSNKSLYGQILTQLYRDTRQQSLSASRANDMELLLEEALRLAGRFDFERAASILHGILQELPLFSNTVVTLRLQARCLTQLGNIRRDQGQVDGIGGAYRLYSRARDIWQVLGEMGQVALCTWYLGACHEMLKNYTEALKSYKEAIDLVETIGDLEILRGKILLRIGTVLTKKDAYEEAERTINSSLYLLGGRVPDADYGFAQQKLAIVYLYRGYVDKAQRLIYETLRLIPKDDRFRQTQTKILMTDLLLSIGDEDAGLTVASEAETLALQCGFEHQRSTLYEIVNKHAFRATSSHVTATRSVSHAQRNELLEEIYQVLYHDFTEQEISDLCAKVGLEYGDLDGESRSAKIRSLLIRANLLGKLDSLISFVHRNYSA